MIKAGASHLRDQDGPVNLLQRLKSETALAHDRIEQAFDLQARTSSKSAYRDLLARLYGFHAVWEPRVQAVLPDPELFRGRQKTGHLIDDLRALGMADCDIGELPLCRSLMPLHSSAEAIGSMYVIEGSTLGGAIIARHVERGLGCDRRNGCSYFRCYGEDVGPMWKTFGAKLLLLCRRGESDAVIASANRTFEVLQAWICGDQSNKGQPSAYQMVQLSRKNPEAPGKGSGAEVPEPIEEV